MKRAICAILLTILAASSAQAGFVNTINISSGSGSDGSLGFNGSGASSYLVGTNLAVPSITTASGSTALGGYLDFQTGTFTGTDSSGNSLYSGSNSNFFVESDTLSNPNRVAYAKASPAGPSVVKLLSGSFHGTDQEYELTMSFSLGFLYPPISTDFSSPSPGSYSGTLDLIFVNNSNLAGNQVISGIISFTLVPEPSSLALVLIGSVGLLGFGGRRLRRVA